ncbi:MAG: hypothetical protein KatS3mg031_3106 [Chitinophagales bacterium]|nr:MAG: hypothetical protein KatS3mg031_3106 [Chitinophagales bacterium]
MKNKTSIVTLAVSLLLVTSASSQVTQTTNTATGNPEYVGWDGTGGNTKSLDIENRFSNEDIIFRTNDGISTNDVMIIKDDGNVGIGYNHAPNHQLDVAGGDINIYGMANGYRIGGSGGMPSKYVLWHNGNIANIYVGVDAGNASGTGTSNTFVGNGAGLAITNGRGNMFLGTAAGTQNTSGSDNVFIGESAGSVNQTGGRNVYIGQRSGVFSTSSGNTFAGYQSGAHNTVGDSNVFVGYKAGFGNTIGSANTFIGYNAQGAGTPNNLNNATTIGANTIARVSNSMIIGDNNVNVGIGLSNDPSGPLNKLEINADPNNFTHTGIGGRGENDLGELPARFKSVTAKKILKLIAEHPPESRKEWMLYLFRYFAKNKQQYDEHHFWHYTNRPVELYSNAVIDQKVNYIHNNPVEAGIVTEPQYYMEQR